MTFIAGLLTPFEGVRLFFKHASIRKLVMLPLITSMFVFFVGVWGFFRTMPSIYEYAREPIMQKLQPSLTEMENRGLMDSAVMPIDELVKISVYLMAFIVFAIFLFVIISIAYSVFWELIAEEVDRLYNPNPRVERTSYQKWIAPLTQEFMKQGVFVGLLVFSYVVIVIPIIGAAISLILGPVAITVWFSFMISDYWMVLHVYSFRTKMMLVWKYLMYFVAMGSYLALPLVGFVFYPFFVIGSAYQWAKYSQIKRVEDGSSTPHQFAPY